MTTLTIVVLLCAAVVILLAMNADRRAKKQMIFKQIDAIILAKLKRPGGKTQTRRAYKQGETARAEDGTLVVNEQGERVSNKPIHTIYTAKGRVRWEKGGNYAAQPKRGNCCAWWDGATLDWDFPSGKGWALEMSRESFEESGFKELRITVNCLGFEKLQEITGDEARKEGYPPDEYHQCPVAWYHDLWNAINKGRLSWRHNPSVWVISFE